MSQLLNWHMAAFQQMRLVYPKCCNSPYLPLPLSTMQLTGLGDLSCNFHLLSCVEHQYYLCVLSGSKQRIQRYPFNNLARPCVLIFLIIDDSTWALSGITLSEHHLASFSLSECCTKALITFYGNHLLIFPNHTLSPLREGPFSYLLSNPSSPKTSKYMLSLSLLALN